MTAVVQAEIAYSSRPIAGAGVPVPQTEIANRGKYASVRWLVPGQETGSPSPSEKPHAVCLPSVRPLPIVLTACAQFHSVRTASPRSDSCVTLPKTSASRTAIARVSETTAHLGPNAGGASTLAISIVTDQASATARQHHGIQPRFWNGCRCSLDGSRDWTRQRRVAHDSPPLRLRKLAAEPPVETTGAGCSTARPHTTVLPIRQPAPNRADCTPQQSAAAVSLIPSVTTSMVCRHANREGSPWQVVARG